MENKKIIGLIGGMGPFAGIELCRLILQKSSINFGAKDGKDFPEVILDSVPVPDFISDTSSLPEAKTMLISRIKRLNKFGCTTIAMACNTGHILFPELSKTSNVKMVSIINSVKDRVVKSNFKKVGLLATRTTIKSNLYINTFNGTGIKVVIPDEKLINICEDAIRSVIADNISRKQKIDLLEVTKKFIKNNNLDGIILGCTELPLVFPKNKPANFVDCLDVLSDVLLKDYFSGKQSDLRVK
jgi:aspartate racemase